MTARILADSINPCGVRLTTFEIELWKPLLAELNTHRMLSRNAASSRAIPADRAISQVRDNPFKPVWWGENQSGMQARKELIPTHKSGAQIAWDNARKDALFHATTMASWGAHKQLVNRLLEPWMTVKVIVSATDWENFFNLRCHPDAQPELRVVAEAMRDALNASTPARLTGGQWHLPLVPDLPELVAEGYLIDDIVRISAGRCARVSVERHDGVRDPKADLQLCAGLIKDGHMSPAEHPAKVPHTQGLQCQRYGNFTGFVQLRKTLPGEDVFRPGGAPNV